MKGIKEQIILTIITAIGGWGLLVIFGWMMADEWLKVLAVGLTGVLVAAGYEGWQRARNLERGR